VGAAIVAAAIVGVLLGIYHTAVHLQQDPLADVPGYYAAAQRLNAGQPLYASGVDADDPAFYRYPPLLAVALRPFALLPFPVFAGLWEVGTIVALFLLVRRLGVSRRTGLGLAILGNQIGDVVPIGQAHMHITWLMALGTPLSVALAGQIKLFPALLALYWVGRGEIRKVAQFLGWTALLLAIQFVLAPDALIDFGKTLALDQVGTNGTISPYQWSRPLWLGLVLLFLVVTPLVARTRFGWPVAVAYSTLVYPRLFWYHLLTLAAALRRPEDQDNAVAVRPRQPDSA